MIRKSSMIYIICSNIVFIETARILAVIPTPSISHQVVFRPITQELVRRGHEVVVITTDPAFPKGTTHENLTEIDIHDLSYSLGNKMMMEKADLRDSFDQIQVIVDTINHVFEVQMKSKEVQELLTLKENHFDLILIEACVRSALGFSHVFKAPVIQISSFIAPVNNHDVMGSPSHPFLYPAVIRDRLYNLSMWEKVKQLYKEFQFSMFIRNLEENENIAMKRIFGANVPPLHKLYENIEMLFLNVHPIWDNNRPVPPGVIYMGGLHQNPQKELPEDLKSYLDSSKYGVVYFSLGTNVKPSHLTSEKLKVIIEVFSRLPYDILWKWDNDVLPGRSNNIKISKWLPQSDLLRHPKIKLFITQGGLQSTDEAITAGVPLIGIPILADQWYNVENYVRHKIGLRVDLDTLNEETLQEAIEAILNDKSYGENILKLRRIMQDQPQTPLERAVFWTEYVLRHGKASNLRSPAANISWTDYLEIELALIIVTALILSFAVLYIVSKAIWDFIHIKLSILAKSKVA